MAVKTISVYCAAARLCAAVLIFLMPGAAATAQRLPFKEYTPDDGLPMIENSRITQDSRGYFWITGSNGVTLFDSHSFKTFGHKDGLPSNQTTSVLEDPDGIVWVSTPKGFARFNGTGFTGFPPPDSLNILRLSVIAGAAGSGRFFMEGITAGGKSHIFYFDNGRYTDYSIDNPALRDITFTMTLYDPADSALHFTDENTSPFVFKNGVITSLGEGPVNTLNLIEGRVIYSFREGDYLFDGTALKPYKTRYTPEHTGLTLDNQYNPQNLILTDGTDSIPIHWEKDRVMQPYLDRENVLWVLTDNYLYRLLSKAFRSYNYDDGLIEEPWAIAADTSGGLLIGSVTNGLQYFNGKSFIRMRGFENLLPPAVAFYRGSITLSTGEVWLSTNTGVLIWNGSRFSKLKGLRENVQICSIYEDPVDKRIFIGTEIGMFIRESDSIRFFPEMSVPEMGVAEGFARTDKGNHWIAGHYGLRVFDGKTFTAVIDINGPTEFVWGLVKDYMGNIWAAGGEGVFICSPDSLTTGPALPQKDNLPANVIRDMGGRRLIVGRMTDVCIIDLEEYYAGNPEYYHILGRSHGFTGNDCQDNGIVRSSDGKWWILTSDGLISFDPSKLVKNETPPLSYITSVERLDNSQVWNRITELDSSLFYSKSSSLVLKKRVNALRINFTAISTTNPQGVTYNYRLHGYNNNWENGTKERSVTYDRLGPGRYVYELNAFNDDGVGTEKPVILPITVLPTFMQTFAVKITLTLLIIGLIVLLTVQVRRRITENRIRAARNQAESYRLQLNSVIKQFDPHFTFNAVTSVGALIMKGEKEKAYNYFIKLSNLLRSVLTDSSVLLKPLSDEIDFVTRYCELQKLRFGDRFSFEIKTDADVDRTTRVPKMIIQSFVENSVKHGLENKNGEGMVNIYITSLKNGLGILVRDNGIGRTASTDMQTGGGGLGLKNIRSLIDTLNRVNSTKITFNISDLYNENTPSGTEASIFIPQPYNFDLS